MKYIESRKLKNNPFLYEGIESSVSWVFREKYFYNVLEKQNVKDKKILDIGCGNGYFLKIINDLGCKNIYGADIANYSRETSCEFQVVDINVEKLKWNDDFFDIITAFQVLEHLENYFLILQEVTRILKKGGLFIFSIPNQFNIFYRIKFSLTGNMSSFSLKNNHLLFLTKDIFEKTYLKNFELVDIFYRKGPVPMLGRLNIIPGINFPAKTRLMPRNEWFSDRVCYILKKK